VELWENERWSASGNGDVDGGGSGGGRKGKTYLRGGAERSSWTRGIDGWNGVLDDGRGDVGSVFCYTFHIRIPSPSTFQPHSFPHLLPYFLPFSTNAEP